MTTTQHTWGGEGGGGSAVIKSLRIQTVTFLTPNPDPDSTGLCVNNINLLGLILIGYLEINIRVTSR